MKGKILLVNSPIRVLLRSLNPFSYDKLSELVVRIPIMFFILTIVFSVLVYSALSVPGVMEIRDDLRDGLEQFTSLELSINATADNSISIPTKDPILIVDLTVDDLNTSKSKYTITRKNIIEKDLIGVKRTNLSDYKDIRSNSRRITRMATTLFIFSLPMLIIYIILKDIILFGAIGVLAAFIGLLICRFSRFNIRFPAIMKISLFASVFASIPITTGRLSIIQISPIFRYGIYGLLFCIYLTIGIIKSGSFRHKKTA